jgi:hypothetical protein
MAAFAAPLIGLGTSIVGGILGSSAAKKAAAAQAGAANTAANKIITTAGDVNKGISDAEVRGNGQVNDAANSGKAAVVDAGGRASSGVLGATQTAVDRLNPYVQTGTQATQTLGTMLGPDGELMKDFTGSDMEKYDPGYQFRIDQANKALQRSAAAHGSALGGGTLKALADFSQNDASAEFGNAFGRYQSNRNAKYSMLSDTAKTGLQAGEAAGQLDLSGHQIAGNFDVGTNEFGANLGLNAGEFQAGNSMRSAEEQGSNFMSAAKTWGDDVMGAANATASGYMGAANAWSSALGGVAKAASTPGLFGGQPESAPAGFTPYASARAYNPNASYGSLPTMNGIPPSMGFTPDPGTLGGLGIPGY